MKQLLTISEAADILRLHPLTVRSYIINGQLRAAKMGRVWRIRQEDLEAFIESRRAQPVEPPEPPGEERP